MREEAPAKAPAHHTQTTRHGSSRAPTRGTVAHRPYAAGVRLVTYESPRGARAGVIDEGGVIDAWDLLEEPGSASVRDLLVAERLSDLESALAPPDGAERIEEPRLAPPIPDPEKIVCIGLNYRAHAAEAGLDPPETPAIFGKYRNALAAPGAAVRLPAASNKIDYEAEVAFVIGRRAKDVAAADALSHVAGYMLFNDLSARDLQFATPQWMGGKVFDGSAPCGPALVTPDDAGPHDRIEFRLELNGEVMQAASTDDLIASIPELVAHLSTLMTLEPGDVIATGTPSGVGSVRQPRVWLKHGDEIVISSPTLGTLATHIRG
jgi:2-keto-4-pentenoate hydratase/2-oxohepta-3-ene-1,7-dioic acid hydratase in catechol pathway